MSIVKEQRPYHVPILLVLIALSATSIVVLCAVWYASKKFQERQRELENLFYKRTIITIILTVISGLLFERLRTLMKKWNARNTGFAFEPRAGGGARERGRCALYAWFQIHSSTKEAIISLSIGIFRERCVRMFILAQGQTCIDMLSFFTKLHICKHWCHGKGTFTGCAADNEENKDKMGRWCL